MFPVSLFWELKGGHNGLDLKCHKIKESVKNHLQLSPSQPLCPTQTTLSRTEKKERKVRIRSPF